MPEAVQQQPPPQLEIVRSRSESRRRKLSPAGYVVEKITVQAARELSANPPQMSSAPAGQEAPSSPPLLLRAYNDSSSSSSSSGSECGEGEMDVSDSSDEDDIRDRLKSLLPPEAQTVQEQVDPYMTVSEPKLDTEVAEELSALPTSVVCDDADGDARPPFATPIPQVFQNSPPLQEPELLAWPADSMTFTVSGLEADRLPWLSLPTPRLPSAHPVFAPLQASWPPSLEASPA